MHFFHLHLLGSPIAELIGNLLPSSGLDFFGGELKKKLLQFFLSKDTKHPVKNVTNFLTKPQKQINQMIIHLLHIS